MDIKYKLFPYPVLWNKNDDYKTSTFDCDIQLQREIKKFNLKVHFKLDNTELAEMIKNEEWDMVLNTPSQIEVTPPTIDSIIEKRAKRTEHLTEEEQQ